MDWSSDVCSSDLSREESEDFTKAADVWTKADCAKKAPGIDWPAFFSAAQLDGADKFGAYHAKAITGLSALVASQPLEAWKDWLAFHQINSHADVLPSAIDHAPFAFYGTILSGTPEQPTRDKPPLAPATPYLGHAV